MPHRKVYAAYGDDSDRVLQVEAEDEAVVVPRSSLTPEHFLVGRSSLNASSTKPSSRKGGVFRACRRLYRRVSRPLVKLYKRLPWTTRETAVVVVKFYTVLYVFLSVPFRLAFYYNPFQQSEREQVHRWTEELSIFTTMDIVADVIGVVEFLGFYRVWKDAFSQLSESVSFELGKKLTRDANRLKAPQVLIRRPSVSSGLRRGKAKWTLASIRPLSSMPGGAADDSSFQWRVVFMRNLEFLLEVIALLPMEVIPFATGAFNALHLARLNKLCRLHRLHQYVRKIASIYSDRAWVQHLSSTGIDTLVQNITLCAGLCHYVACGYMLIAHAQCGLYLEACDDNVETSWAIRDHLKGATVARKYARTLYWASKTMVLLGFDDVTPVSNGETVYAIVATLMGALFGSSVLATFLFIFRFRNARYAAFATHVDNAREYMRSQNITRTVRRQVIAYFSYSWSTHHSLDSEEALHIMPKHLQSKVIATLKASRVKQVCFLMKESVEFINLLALALVRRVYSPSDQITEPKFNAQMFFVIRGKVMLSAINGSKPKECQTGDFFADSCLFFPDKYEEKAVAKTFCELYALAKEKFDEALTHFHRGSEPDVRARMIETLDKYSTQLRKTKKLLGLRGARESDGRNSHGGSGRSVADDSYSGEIRHGVSWRLPGSVFRVHWDTVRLFAIVYVAFEVPFFSVFIAMTDDQDMFAEEPGFGVRYGLTMLAEVFFVVDLVLRARYFAYLDQSVMLEVMQPDLIFAAYQASGFYLDLLAWLPVGIVFDSLPAASVKGRVSLFRLLRLLRVREIPNLLRNISDFHSVSSKTYFVISLLLGVTLMLHVVGCVWFELAWIARGKTSEDVDWELMSELSREQCLQDATLFQNCSWVKFDCYANVGSTFPLQDSSSTYTASFAYLRAVYWAIVTLTAVGYGDIVAYSTAETYFAVFWIFVGGVINFGVVGAMSSIISSAMATRHHHIDKLNTLNSLLERLDISDKLSAEIRRFYHHQFLEHKHAYESQLLSHLPDQLCYQISSLLHSEAVKSVSLFDSASTEFLHEVTGKFRHRSYQHGETICLEGDICKEFFVFLHGSKVNVFFHVRKVPIRALHEGDCYGVSQFLLRRAHTATLIAASHVHASVMTREQFGVIQQKFAGDLGDMKEEANALWSDQQRRMRRIVSNLERLKLQTHMMQTPTLFCQQSTTITTTRKSGKLVVRDVDATRNTFSSTWNAIITCWNIYNAIFVIFRICFHSHLHFSGIVSAAVWLADLACDFCFAADIYLRLYYFGCPEVELENLVSRKEKDEHYLRSSTFKWDLLASLPIYVPGASLSVAASLCRLPRLVRCVDLFVYMDDVIVQIQQHFASRNVSAYLSPAKLLVILVIMAHVTGCIFFLISEKECEHVDHCWMAHDHLIHQYHHSVPILYAKSFYWAITTLLLVGSRESVPRDAAGTLWTGFTCLCCTFIIGHIVGEISELILELGKETKQYKGRIASFESFAKEHDVPTTLRERVQFFFRLQFQHTEGLDLHTTVHDLSANLRLKLMLEIYGHPIALLPISRFLTASQVNNLALRLQSELFIPGDNILVEGTFGSRLCTLRKGVAAALWASSMTSVAILMEGALFGEIAFFLAEQRRLATVKATTSCEVLYVTKHDWQELWTTEGDLSDSQVQKHSLHAILDWVYQRLRRYQRTSLRTASKAKRVLASRQTPTGLQARLSGTASVIPLLAEKASGRMNFSSEIQVLEKKTTYLLLKADAVSNQFRQALAALQVRRRVSSAVSNRSTHRSNSRSISRSKRLGTSSDIYRSTMGDVAKPVVGDPNSKNDIHLLQFIVDLNPVNKLVREDLSAGNLRRLEAESWSSFKVLAAVQHTARKLMDELIPPDTAFSRVLPASGHPGGNRAHIRIQYSRTFGRQSSLSGNRHQSGHLLPATAPGIASRKAVLDSATKTSMVARSIGLSRPGDAVSSMAGRRFSVAIFKNEIQQPKAAIKANPTGKGARLTRSNSLPLFDSKYFETLQHETNNNLRTAAGRPCRANIDFDIIQRCQRPQYATQLRLYHCYRRWKNPGENVRRPTLQQAPANPATILKRLSDVRPSLRGNLLFLDPNRRSSNGGQRPSLIGKFQFANDPIETIDPTSKVFIRRVKEMGRMWDIIMLLVAIYHLIITPFKLCFATDLVELPGGVLCAWSGIEIVLDALCVVDLSYKIRYATLSLHSMGASLSRKHQDGCRRIFDANPALRADILALLPLELLLFATDVRVPLAYVPSVVETAHASWWTSRWLLRLNRVLLARRIELLSEQLLQFVIYDRKIPANEAFLYFLKGLMSYLTMGHLLACIWFVTSELAFHHYGTSWLSTSGMLTFIPDATEVETTVRRLSEGTAHFYLESVSLSRKYLRSLLFSMECISTLFNGDILSMNPLELVAEIGITLWSIYIYGALVGAQGELLDARARREAAFEQSLGELQHYLVQNEVPKKLKRQIKSYYARVWRYRKGGKEFAAVDKVSHTLYEDVVLATLRRFVTRVAAFRSLDEHFLRGLLVCLKYVVCSEGEEVAMKGDVNRSMYFISTGRVLIKLDSSESIRDPGEFFGELTLLYGISRLETCIALTLTELYRLDQQPYERLLQDFPECRERNKLEWTSVSAPAPDRAILEAVVRNFQRGSRHSALPHSTASSVPVEPAMNSNTQDVVANTERINADIPSSHVYRFVMDLLAQLHRVDPLEARDLVLQGRAKARKHLKALLGLATSRDELPRKETHDVPEAPIDTEPHDVPVATFESVSTYRAGDDDTTHQLNKAHFKNVSANRTAVASTSDLLLLHSMSYANLLEES
jgi:CRP-like cAMP-binding protein/voltage-gated potassium channel Kch